MKFRSIFHKSILVLDKQLSPTFCDHLIKKFEADQRKTAGVTGGGFMNTVKQSTDLMLSFGEAADDWKYEDAEISMALKNAIIKYDNHCEKHFPGMREQNQNIFDIGHQMQRTHPGGFYNWHNDACDSRSLTYIFYINDVNGGDGYTEFCDGTRVYPKAGRMCIFPATWQYMHRGVAPKKDLKYIVTGWLYTPLTGDEKVMEFSNIGPKEVHQHHEEHGNLEDQQPTEIH